MTDHDATNYLNSSLCEPPSPAKLDDFADLLERKRVRLAGDDEARFMLQTLELCFRRGRADFDQLHRAAGILAELSQLWSRHHGPNWVLTPKAEQVLGAMERRVSKLEGVLQFMPEDPTPPPADRCSCEPPGRPHQTGCVRWGLDGPEDGTQPPPPVDEDERADVLRQRQELAAAAGDDGPDLISDAGEGC